MDDLIRIMKQVMTGILCVVLVSCPVFLMHVSAAETPKGLYSAGAVLMDADSGRILFEKNQDLTYAMASTTKIMTCILALELGDLEQVVTISEHAAAQPNVQMNAKAGEQYYLRDLLYSTMLESHNDSAAAVAEAIGGSEEAFVKMMDKKAEAIGCIRTNFVTSNGLDGTDEEGDHCTTAKELAMILRYCIMISSKAKEFMEITGTLSYTFQELTGRRQISCSNHNAFLSSYEGAFTGKTGFTGKAGYCYTGAARRDNETMILALLGAGGYPHKSYKWKDAEKLFNYGFENFSYQMVGKSDWQFERIPVIGGMEEDVLVKTDAVPFTFLISEKENIQCRTEIAKQLQAPVEKNMVVGTIFYELNGSIIEQFQIYTAEETEKSTFWNHTKKWIRIIQDFVGKLINK